MGIVTMFATETTVNNRILCTDLATVITCWSGNQGVQANPQYLQTEINKIELIYTFIGLLGCRRRRYSSLK